MGSFSFPAPAGRSTAFCKWLLSEHARGNSIKRAANNWNGTLCESSLAVTWASVWFEGARSECKRQMNCLCFPFCLFKYWNTKSFRREIIQASQSKWDSLQKNRAHFFFSFFKSLHVCVGVCGFFCVTSAKPAGIGSCEQCDAGVRHESTRRMQRGLIECLSPSTMLCESGSHPI